LHQRGRSMLWLAHQVLNCSTARLSTSLTATTVRTPFRKLTFGSSQRCAYKCPPNAPPGKGKGCDIGYGLATSSCEGANSVDACTVTALDAITAFAVPDPNLLLAEPVGFFGSWCPANHFTEPDHSAYFGPATIYFSQPFRPSTSAIIINDR
jgi:hypothetical protein